MSAPAPGTAAVAVRAFGTGFRFQLTAMRGQADTYFSLIASPFFALVFLSAMEYSGRTELYAHAVLAPMLMTAWTAALMFSGEMISDDRQNGRLEPLVATPAPFPLVLLGRLCACMLLSVPSFVMSVLIAGALFGYWLPVHHPLVFGAALLLVVGTTAAMATALSALFVVAPGARIVQNTLSFPVFLLGGVLVPVSELPGALAYLGRLLPLSWGADLLRAATRPEPVQDLWLSLGMMLLLGLTALLFGMRYIARFLAGARATGTLSRE
ncbi:ABC transporter permease [Streptomyces sp. NBC_00441]|uniref:ABC transporter permease n=1 Tax=Streptomyces sp. NBC_00441 TaxID=2975742 RepID=UPI002E284C87|nr:ABC transporter permease [Streptomyces sp. NBC_00441]